jgi:hypothetical protein
MFSIPIGASVMGAEHLETLSGNQDAHVYGQVMYDDFLYTYGIVADGMGARKFSGAGGAFAVAKSEEILLDLLAVKANRDTFNSNHSFVPQQLYNQMLTWLSSRFDAPPAKLEAQILDYYMFTLMGFVIGPEVTILFRAGDGIFGLNGELFVKHDKAPEYMALHLLPVGSKFRRPNLKREFEVFAYYTRSIHEVLIATDGLIKLQEFLKQGLLTISNSSMLLRALIALVRRELLRDDGTIILTRRANEA